MLAPIVVFVYNRRDKAEKLIESLVQNSFAAQSDLIVFSDGPKMEQDEKVKAVRCFLDEYPFLEHFASVRIIKAEKNQGLAQSIIHGVSSIIKEYEKVIVVEDDNIVAEDFLEYMNEALDFYEKNPKVWSISGYSHIVPEGYEHDVYAMGRINSYAWGTWKRSWDATDWEVKDYNKFKFDFIQRSRFNKYGKDLSMMLDMQMAGKISSWAIRFSYAMFKNQMMTIYPCHSKTKNWGEDGSGTHVEKTKVTKEIELSKAKIIFEELEIEDDIVRQFTAGVHRGVATRCTHYMKTVLLKG